MKVYVITDGDYSDYHICGVSLNEEDAKKIRDLCGHYAEVEEYDTEEWSPFLHNGELYSVNLDGEKCSVSKPSGSFDWYKDDINHVRKYWATNIFHVIVIAKNDEHAKKIGLDLIYQYKYENI